MARSIYELEDYLKKRIKDIVDKEMIQLVAEEARDIIYKRVKSGKGLSANVKFGANIVPLKKLSTEYITVRGKRILGPYGVPKKSNLTLTGELLEAMVFKIIGNGAILYIDNKTHEESGLPTQVLAQYVSEQGRPFFGLAVREEKILTAFIQRLIRARSKRGN